MNWTVGDISAGRPPKVVAATFKLTPAEEDAPVLVDGAHPGLLHRVLREGVGGRCGFPYFPAGSMFVRLDGEAETRWFEAERVCLRLRVILIPVGMAMGIHRPTGVERHRAWATFGKEESPVECWIPPGGICEHGWFCLHHGQDARPWFTAQ